MLAAALPEKAAYEKINPILLVSSRCLSLLWSPWQLQLEVDRLEELKLQNMKSVVQAIRAELAEFWDKCFYSQEQREAFSPYYDGGCWFFLLVASLWELLGVGLPELVGRRDPAASRPCWCLLQRTTPRPFLSCTTLRC